MYFSHVHHYSSTVLFHFFSQDGWTALMCAIYHGHTALVQMLLSSGAQVDLQDKVRHIMFLRS